MAIYGQRLARATKKRTRAKKKVSKPTVRGKAEVELKKRKPKKKAASARATKTRARAKKRVGRPGKRKAGVKKPAKRKVGVRRPARRKAGVKKPAKKAAVRKRAPTKKATVKKQTRAKIQAKKPSKKVIRRETRKIREAVKKLTRAEQKARGKPKRSAVKKKIRAKKREVGKRRVRRSLIIQKLPRKTPTQKRRSVDSDWDRRQRRFIELFNIAKETGQTPIRKRLPRKVSSRYNIGEQRVVPIDRIVSEDEVEDIIYRVEQTARKMKGTFSLWSSTLFLSTFGEKMIGSGGTLIELTTPDQDAMFFTTETHESTGDWNSYTGMKEQLRNILESLASAGRTIVFLHYIKLFNQNRK